MEVDYKFKKSILINTNFIKIDHFFYKFLYLFKLYLNLPYKIEKILKFN